MALHVSEIRKTRVADKVDLILADIKIVDRVLTDGLSEDEYILAARASQEIVARQGKDWRAGRIDLDVVAKLQSHGAAVGLRPRLCYGQHHSPGEVSRTCDCQRAWIARLRLPGSVREERGAINGPAGWNAGDREREQGTRA